MKNDTNLLLKSERYEFSSYILPPPTLILSNETGKKNEVKQKLTRYTLKCWEYR